jgi:hypothetical protein
MVEVFLGGCMKTVNELQHRLIKSKSKIVVAANSRGAGHTTGLILKSILDETVECVQFYQPTYSLMNSMFSETIRILKSMDFKYTTHKITYCITLESGKKLMFCLPDNEVTCELNLRGKKRTGNILVVLDQVDFFKQYFIDYQIEMQRRNNNVLIFSTTPYHCGWRDIKTSYGYPILSSNGVPETVSQSWDYDLIDWSKLGMVTRTTPEAYKEGVEVIYGYGVNFFLTEENPMYMKYLGSLLQEDKRRLSGTWQCGLEMVESKDMG